VSTSSEHPAAPEPAQHPPTSEQRALLDTTVQIDRKKTESRRSKLEEMLARYGWRFSTGISLVEFKATLIQNCLTIHNQLRRTGARFTRVRDALLEKMGQQIALRAHIFNNIIQIYGASFEITEEEDRRLAEKARLLLENIIPQLYHWFAKESVDVVLNERLGCNRANEPPHKKKAAFEVNLPDCKRGKNKTCSVEAVIRSDGPQLLRSLQPDLAQSEQLQNAAKVFQDVIDNPRRELSHGDCRNAGDCLIALEAKDKPTHALSSNAREWAPISAVMGYEFVRIAYAEEQSK
jgi:hypothetical protein